MKNVAILGLGYVGLEICELYKNQPNVVVLDKEFYPERVKLIKEWGLNFYQRDIFNTKDVIGDSELIYNTVSVTLVPQKKEDSNPQIDQLIHKFGTEGNRYLIENLNKDSKLVFLSTHVVFEESKKTNISEDDLVCPLLAYGVSKAQSEEDIKKAGINHIIARLGSSYGYNMAMRYKIVTNLFAKMAAIEKKIKVFGGEVYKPVVGTKDLARGLKFLSENYNKETFHLISENIKVKDIARICQDCSPSICLETLPDDSSDEGYTLSNEKLLKTGFQFNQNIKEEIKAMIGVWS
jgi:dTDP-4-dehydrorhamnose reductase